MRRYNVALFGVGRWGKIYLKNLLASTSLNLVAVYSSNPETRQNIPGEIRVYQDWNELLEHEPKLDAIIIATPPDIHAVMAMAALKRGLGILVEKPLTLSLAESQKLATALNENPRAVFLVNHIQLFSSAYEVLKQHVFEEGGASAIRSTGCNWGPFRNYSTVWDYAPHDIAFALDLFGSMPEKIICREEMPAPKEGKPGRDGLFTLDLYFSKNRVAEITVGNASKEKIRRLEVDTKNGTWIFDDLITDKLFFRTHNIEKSHGKEITQVQPLVRVLDTFAEALSGKFSPRLGIEMGLNIVKILEQCKIQY